MPTCGSQIILCDIPIHFDTYKGCSHGCQYCFANRKNDANRPIEYAEKLSDLKDFIEGKRTIRTNWCDWPAPIHWGAMSDPFQPIEKERKASFQCLELFAETQHPFIFSTKGKIIAEPNYLSILKECNVVAQISLVAPSYDEKEPGAPPFFERIAIIENLAKVCKRVIVRMQPLFLEATKAIIQESIPILANTGCFGITVEGFKAFNAEQRIDGMVRLGGDYVYKYSDMKQALLEIRDEAHKYGLAFFSGENRFRQLGDSLTCCGCEGVPGFESNYCNLNHFYYGDYSVTEAQKEPGTGDVFAAIPQDAGAHQMCMPIPFNKLMETIAYVRPIRELMGVERQTEQLGLF